MKLYATIGKIVAAIAAIAGIAFLVIKYMDAIKAWLGKLCPCVEVELEDDFVADDEIPAEPAEEAAEAEDAAEDAAEEAPAEDAAPADEANPVAEEADFEA